MPQVIGESYLRLDITDAQLLSLRRVSVAHRTHFVLTICDLAAASFEHQLAYRLIDAERRYAALLVA